MDLADQVSYHDLGLKELSEAHINTCCQLFSEHYATRLNGEKVKMGPRTLLRSLPFGRNCRVVLAKLGEKLIGQAFYTLFEVGDGKGIWITQLVVHSEYRGKRIATTLLGHVMAHQWDFCGLVSSHPYAVRALESAGNQLCDPKIVKKHAEEVIRQSRVSYLDAEKIRCTDSQSVIDTDFEIDHTKLNDILSRLPDWNLGALPDRFEFVAILAR